MHANDALKLSEQYWASHEEDFMKYVIGFQTKIETAANEGRISCTVGVLPSGNPALMDFVAHFFEQQGYYTMFQGTQTGEIAVGLNWKNKPIGSRPFHESESMRKALGID